MTYLFVVIGVSVMNALANKKMSYSEIMLANVVIVSSTALLEYVWLLKQEITKVIVYEQIENIKPENYDLLIADLEKRTGISINKAEVGDVDFLKDTAKITIHYDQKTK